VDIAFRVIGRPPGAMIDVGAHWGTTLAAFLESGWTVYAFEPDPTNRAVLSSDYPGAIIDSRAISEIDGDTVALYTSDVSTGISTLSPFHPTHAASVEVETVRLDTYIHSHQIAKIDFLKTDVEGFDLFVLRTFPWESHHPRAVVCEFEDNKTSRLGYTVHDIAKFLEQKGYSVMVSEWYPVVEYGGNHKWRRFTHYPTDDIPSNSCGNLIAIEPRLLNQLVRECDSAGRKYRLRGRALAVKARWRR